MLKLTKDFAAGFDMFKKNSFQLLHDMKGSWVRRYVGAVIIIVIVIILAGVLGPVLGRRRSQKHSAIHRIAAVSYENISGNITRLYYQDHSGALFEASSSGLNPDSAWNKTSLGFQTLSGTPLAAAVSRPDFAFVGI